MARNHHVETISHILTSCEANTWSLIKERHDRVVYQMVLALAKSQSLKVPDSWGWRAQGWQGVGVIVGDKAKLVVDVSMQTDRDLTVRRPDIIMYLKERNQIVILEVSAVGRTGKGEIQQVPGTGSGSCHPAPWMEGRCDGSSSGKSGNHAELQREHRSSQAVQ